MNKSAIQKYAIWARNELRDQIAKRGYYFGIDADGINVDGKDETCVYARDGRLLTDTERKQRNELFRLVKEKGFDQVVEEVSYTWFNRLIALRFMEVNDYLPEHIRVLSNANNEFKPEIKTRALDLEDPHFDKKKILDLIDKNDDEELYRYLLLTECNALNDILPQMFEKIGGYTELLLPYNLLKADSVIGKLVSDIDEADWDVKSEGGQVQIIGWLYQYYNQELKDQTFNDLKKKNKKISKERIPAATQLFTPDWIVHYMVENSLGRMWVEGHPNDELKSTWKYYLEEAEQEPEVEEQLKEIRKEYSKLNPQDIKFLDPAMGSGHILVVAFDILMQIYESQGIRPREAAKSILENNLYGLDIDDRAAQLAYFAVMMKAREYDRKIFSRGIQPNLYSIQESNGIDDSLIDYVARGDKKLRSDLKTLVKEMKDAKEYGSIITVSELDFDRLQERLNEIRNDSILGVEEIDKKIASLVEIGRILSRKYEIVCTNPPYMGGSNLDDKLLYLVKEKFSDSKSDIFSVFIDRWINNLGKNGYQAMITQHAWMFLKSFEKLRLKLRDLDTINMVHLGARAFEDIGGEVVQTTSFILRNSYESEYKSTYIRLVDVNSAQEKEREFLKLEKRFIVKQTDFLKISGSPIVYWASSQALKNFEKAIPLSEISRPRVGQNTGDNERFLRMWYEVKYEKIGFSIPHSKLETTEYKWIPYNKGGNFRRWYGNFDRVVNWENNGREIKDYAVIRNKGKHWSRYIQNIENLCREGISWSDIASTRFACRYLPVGFICDVKGSSTYPSSEYRLYLLSFLNSCVAIYYLQMLNPTTTFQVGNIGSLPFIFGDSERVSQLAQDNIFLSKEEWDSFEISWDFKRHPLIPSNLNKQVRENYSLKDLYIEWEIKSDKRFIKLKKNEEELNDIFIRLYHLEDDLVPDINDKDVTVRKADLNRDIKSLISYGIGCIMGRFSVEENGDISFPLVSVDSDGILPITSDEYFEDDIVERFINFIKAVYGKEHWEENLVFIANALGGQGSPRKILRNYFINEFFFDHCKVYQKRPIYWLFDSGKKNGFKCLIYMHRYTPDTLARIRTDYVHEQQERYRSQIKHIQETIDTVPKSEQVKMKKELKDLEAKSKEVAVFEEKLHHLADQMIEIDLDDGVKHNYALFQDVLAKIK